MILMCHIKTALLLSLQHQTLIHFTQRVTINPKSIVRLEVVMVERAFQNKSTRSFLEL